MATETAVLLRELSEPWMPGDKIKAAISRAADAAGLQYSRAYEMWYGRARRVLPAEVDRIETAVARKREQGATNELQQLRQRVSRLERLLYALDASDEDFHRPSTAALREHIREMGGKVGASNSSVD